MRDEEIMYSEGSCVSASAILLVGRGGDSMEEGTDERGWDEE